MGYNDSAYSRTSTRTTFTDTRTHLSTGIHSAGRTGVLRACKICPLAGNLFVRGKQITATRTSCQSGGVDVNRNML